MCAYNALVAYQILFAKSVEKAWVVLRLGKSVCKHPLEKGFPPMTPGEWMSVKVTNFHTVLDPVVKGIVPEWNSSQ